jgi:hypothetical protein
MGQEPKKRAANAALSSAQVGERAHISHPAILSMMSSPSAITAITKKRTGGCWSRSFIGFVPFFVIDSSNRMFEQGLDSAQRQKFPANRFYGLLPGS